MQPRLHGPVLLQHTLRTLPGRENLSSKTSSVTLSSSSPVPAVADRGPLWLRDPSSLSSLF